MRDKIEKTDQEMEDEINQLLAEVDELEKEKFPSGSNKELINQRQIELKELSKKGREKLGIFDKETEELEGILYTNYFNDDNEDVYDIDLTSGERGKAKEKNSGKEWDNRELNELLKRYDKELESEIEQEINREFKPRLDENDVARADKLIKEDELILEALNKMIICKKELVMFIDYYEIFSLINKTKKFTLEYLKIFEKLCEKRDNNTQEEDAEESESEEVSESDGAKGIDSEDSIKRLTKDIEDTLTVSASILKNRPDMRKLLGGEGPVFKTETAVEKAEVAGRVGENVDKKSDECDVGEINDSDHVKSSEKLSSNVKEEDLKYIPIFLKNRPDSKGGKLNPITLPYKKRFDFLGKLSNINKKMDLKGGEKVHKEEIRIKSTKLSSNSKNSSKTNTLEKSANGKKEINT